MLLCPWCHRNYLANLFKCTWIHVHYLQFQRDWQTTQWASSCGSYQTHIQPAVPRRSWKCWRRTSWVRTSSPSLQNSVGSPILSEKSHCILFPQRGRNKPLWCWWSISSSSTCRLASRGRGWVCLRHVWRPRIQESVVRLAPPLPSVHFTAVVAYTVGVFYSGGSGVQLRVHPKIFGLPRPLPACQCTRSYCRYWPVAS